MYFATRIAPALEMIPKIARNTFKQTLSNNRSLFSVNFVDDPAAVGEFLVPVDAGIYRVKDPGSAVVTRSGVVRVGHNYLSLDYGPFAAWNPTFYCVGRRPVHLKAVLPIWSHDWVDYYHWLIDIAPRVADAQRFWRGRLDEVTLLYPGELSSSQRETLELMGFGPERILNLREIGPVTADTIYAMPLDGLYRVHPRIASLRVQLGAAANPQRRLYLSRLRRRRIKNEEPLYRMLKEFGFEFIPELPRTLMEQIKMFAEASYIVSPHGGALSNILWSSNDTQILELANIQYCPGFFGALAEQFRMPYKQMIFGEGSEKWTRMADDFAVDLDRVQEHLTKSWELAPAN